MRFYGVVLFLLILFSCSNSSKKGLIPENQLVKIITEIHIADAVTFSSKYRDLFRLNDSLSYYDHLFSKYNVTRSQFDSTIAWYSGKPDEYEKVYIKVLDRLNRMAATINENIRADSIKTQGGNLWNRKRDWIMPDDGPMENIAFEVKVEKQGTYVLSARIKINPNDQSNRPYMLAYCTRPILQKQNSLDTASLVRLDKSGLFRDYSLSIYLDKDTTSSIKGFILGHDPKTGSWIKNAEVRDIRLHYVQNKDLHEIE